MSNSAAILRVLRKVHLYFGVFIAPALLFFAFTGFLQTAGIQDMANGPHWVKVLAQIHKKQTYVIPQRKPKPAPSPDAAPKHHHDDAGAPAPASAAPATPPAPAESKAVPLHVFFEKLFFFTVCVGLFTSTLTGIYMSYKYNSNKAVVTTLLVLGIVLPLLFLKS